MRFLCLLPTFREDAPNVQNPTPTIYIKTRLGKNAVSVLKAAAVTNNFVPYNSLLGVHAMMACDRETKHYAQPYLRTPLTTIISSHHCHAMNASSSNARSSSAAFQSRTEDLPGTKRFKTMLSNFCQQSCSSSSCEDDSSDVISIIRTMQHQENTVYRPCDYLAGTYISPQDRMDVCQWGFQISDEVEVDRSIAVIAITYFDRFLSRRGLRAVEVCLLRKREFQLAFIVSLHMLLLPLLLLKTVFLTYLLFYLYS
jgi:hypothetical protein